MSNQSYALYYAGQKGWAVLPCHWITEAGQCSCKNSSCSSPGKHPLIRGGVKAATTDLEKIVDWWEDWPNANIAVATGRLSNLLVIDIDIKGDVDGYSSIEELEAEIGLCESNLIVDTPSGGQHRYFAYPTVAIRNSVQKLGPGIDVRSDNGYALVPPSNHVSGGRYVFGK